MFFQRLIVSQEVKKFYQNYIVKFIGTYLPSLEEQQQPGTSLVLIYELQSNIKAKWLSTFEYYISSAAYEKAIRTNRAVHSLLVKVCRYFFENISTHYYQYLIRLSISKAKQSMDIFFFLIIIDSRHSIKWKSRVNLKYNLS